VTDVRSQYFGPHDRSGCLHNVGDVASEVALGLLDGLSKDDGSRTPTGTAGPCPEILCRLQGWRLTMASAGTVAASPSVAPGSGRLCRGTPRL